MVMKRLRSPFTDDEGDRAWLTVDERTCSVLDLVEACIGADIEIDRVFVVYRGEGTHDIELFAETEVRLTSDRLSSDQLRQIERIRRGRPIETIKLPEDVSW